MDLAQTRDQAETLAKVQDAVFLYAAGEKDPNFPPAIIEAVAKTIGGPVQVEIVPDAGHQLMLFETETFSTMVHDFCLANV